jgi:signal transduction histidine kinase
VEEILENKPGTLDYQIKDNPKKIAAFVPMEFENASWVVVINTPYDRVAGFAKRSLRNHLFLLGIIVIAFAAGSMLVIRNERVKIKAEEEVVRWQEKMEERRRAEEALQQERNKLKGILDSMNDGVYIVNREYEVLYTNPAMEEDLGPPKGRKCYVYLRGQPEVCPWCKNKKVFAGETVRWEWRSPQNGKTYELFDRPFAGPDATLCKLGISRDITERKQAEEASKESEKQLRSLSTQLLRAQETERKRISRELHDELGQSLMVMKLRLDFIEKNLLQHQKDLKQECENGVQYVDQVIENIRRLSRDLSPAILEDFGLSAALRWLINNFAKNYNIKVMMDMIDADSLLPRDSHVAVYRTIQEALTNIGKHSQAKDVSISIYNNEDRVLFSIEDDGIGFDERLMNAQGPEGRGLGLEMMKGRCQMVGGVLTIWTQEGKGTRITLSVPVERGATH